jgi:hypothetical protein
MPHDLAVAFFLYPGQDIVTDATSAQLQTLRYCLHLSLRSSFGSMFITQS